MTTGDSGVSGASVDKSSDTSGKTLREFTVAASLFAATNTIGKAATFLLVPLYTHYLTPAESGIQYALYSFFGLASMLYQFGMPNAVIQFYGSAKTDLEKKTLLSSVTLLHFGSSLLLSLILALLAPALSELLTGSGAWQHLIVLIAAMLALETLAQNFQTAMRCDNQVWAFAFIKTGEFAVGIGLSLWFVTGYGMGITGIFLANFYAIVFGFFTSLLPVRRTLSLVFEKAAMEKMLRFGFPLLFYGVMATALDSLDRIIVVRFISQDAGGIYSTGYRLGMLMATLNASVRLAWLPFFNKRIDVQIASQTATQIATHIEHPLETGDANRDAVDNEILFRKIFNRYAALLATVFVVLSCFIKDAMMIPVFGTTLFNEPYFLAAEVMPMVLFAYLISAPTEFLKAGLLKAGAMKALLGSIAASLAVNVSLNFVFALMLPETVLTLQLIAGSTVAAYFVSLALLSRAYRRLNFPRTSLQRFWMMVALGLATVVIHNGFLQTLPLWMRIPFVATACGTILWFGMFSGETK